MRSRIAVTLLATTLLAAKADAQVVRSELDFPKEQDFSVAIDGTGSTIYAVSTTNQFGTNPGYRKQVIRWDAATGAGAPITDYEDGVETASVSNDGVWLAFVSNADLLGTNHDESPELYVMQPDGSGLAQLTSQSFLPNVGRGVARAIISGSGNRVAFVGPVDPLGTNPTYTYALFVIDRDGANLRQLATDVTVAGVSTRSLFDISDDGSKVTYMKGGQIYGINANGTGSHQFTSTTSAVEVSISGNGSKIVYVTGQFPNYNLRARTFDGNPATIVSLGSGERASITDDATVVYFRRETAPAGIWKVNSTGGAATSVAAGLTPVRVSGNGARLAALGSELVAIDNAGGNLQQLSTTAVSIEGGSGLAMSSDGSRLWFVSQMDPFGTNPVHSYELFSYLLDSATLTQVTDASVEIFTDYRVSDAGDIVFGSHSNATGQNPCGYTQVYRLLPDGTGLTQLTPCNVADPAPSGYPEIRSDGQLIVYLSGERTGSNTDGGIEIFAMNADGSGRTPLTAQSDGDFQALRIGNGVPVTWVAYSSSTNADGLNPNHRYQIWRVATNKTGLQRLTSDLTYDSTLPDISGDGNRIVWGSYADLTGQNPDHSFEVFLFDATTQLIRQLTSDTGLGAYEPHITRNGAWVFFGGGRISVDTGLFEPASGFFHNTSTVGEFAFDATGGRWIFGASDVIDKSPSNYSFFRAQLNQVPSFQVTKASPTVLTWDPSPTALRYDVIRGSIANLSIAGSTVNLGAVSCIEDDSPDNHTRGHEDPATPGPGQAFFYLYRGSVGMDATVGSYGQGTGGKERVAGGGGCNP